MLTRLFALGLAGLVFTGSTSQVQAQKDSKPPTASPRDELFKKAFQLANDDNFAEAIANLDKLFLVSPDDRSGLLLLSVMTNMAANQAEKDNAAKVTMLRRSVDAVHRLEDRYKPLSPQESKVVDSIELTPARISALEGKPEQSLDALAKIVAGGSDRYVIIDMHPDFESVRRLPDYQAKMLAANQTAVHKAMADFKPFPFDFDLKTIDGKPFKLSDTKGKVTIVDIWGTWCPPCREEIPHFVDLAKKFAGKDFGIVGINCNEQGSPEEVKKTVNDFIAEYKIPYPCVLDDETTASKVPDFQGYPTTLFTDRTGKVRFSQVGYMPIGRLEAIVTSLLDEPTP